jgi:hypothetical protein
MLPARIAGRQVLVSEQDSIEAVLIAASSGYSQLDQSAVICILGAGYLTQR